MVVFSSFEVSMLVLVTQLCPTLCDPWTIAPEAPLSVGIFQTRILEWAAIPFSGGSSQPRDWTLVSCRWVLYHLRSLHSMMTKTTFFFFSRLLLKKWWYFMFSCFFFNILNFLVFLRVVADQICILRKEVFVFFKFAFGCTGPHCCSRFSLLWFAAFSSLWIFCGGAGALGCGLQ